MSHFFSLNAQHLAGFTSGEMLTRLNEDAQGLFKYYYILFFRLAGSVLSLVGILTVLFLQASWLSAILLLASLFAIFLFRIIQERGIPKYIRRAKAVASFNSLLKEILDNSPILRGLSAEEYADAKIKTAMKNRYRESLPAGMMYANLWSASTIVEGIITASGLFLGLLLWDRSRVSLGLVYLVFTYCGLIISPLMDFRTHMGDMQGAKAGILRTLEFLGLKPGIPAGYRRLQTGDRQQQTGAIDLLIENLCFAYNNSEPVLKNLNLTVPAGKHIGIMGETGCGKSTLLSLIAGLNCFDNGSIHLDGMDVRAIDPGSLRQRVAYCTQKVQLMHGSIRDNITFYDESYSDTDIGEAIGILELTDWFKIFPEGLDTHLKMGEASLSSGEAQLLSLVRLSLKKPGLVLLDEISSSLDAVTEKRIVAAVKKMCESRTVLAIAHRKEALDWMDTILCLENGRLCAQEGGGENA